jgi:predicted nucleotidyltransferase
MYIWSRITEWPLILDGAEELVSSMYAHEKGSLGRITKSLREQFPNRITGVYAFGSRARGDHGEWSDFDILVIVKDRDPLIEEAIISSFVEEELRSGLMFTPLIKDQRAFEAEKRFNTPFYENLTKEGIVL